MGKFLKKTKGFTLIELLVVIAIIAILVVIVIIAINPVQRLADAANSRASSNVRAAGTLIQTCITAEQALPTPGPVTGCIPGVGNRLDTYGNVPANVNVVVNDAANDVCARQVGATSGAAASQGWYVYRATTSSAAAPISNAGVVTFIQGAVPAHPCP